MKNCLKSAIALVLTLMLLISASALAEADANEVSDRPIDMQAKIGTKVYTFADTIEGIQAQGITFEDDDRRPGYWHRVNNGRAAFEVLLDAANRETATEAETFVCGYQLTPEKTPNAVIAGGIVLGEATRASIREAFGAPDSDQGTSYYYYLNRRYVTYIFRFTEDADDSPIREVEASTSIPYAFGLEVSEQAGVEQENLPDPADLNFDQYILDGKFYDGQIKVQDLVDNGWRVDVRDADDELDPMGNAGFFISGSVIAMYNGVGMVQVFVYNAAAEGTCTVAEGDVLYIGVNVSDNTSLVIADGLHPGSSFEEVTATFGDNADVEEKDDYTTYEYRMNNTRNLFSVRDGVAFYIRVQP